MVRNISIIELSAISSVYLSADQTFYCFSSPGYLSNLLP